MYLRVHEQEHSSIAALCDKELLGKTFREGERVLDLKVYSDFYKGRLVGEREAAKALRSANSMNLVGARSVALAKKLGLLGGGEVVTIQGVPHAQIYRI